MTAHDSEEPSVPPSAASEEVRVPPTGAVVPSGAFSASAESAPVDPVGSFPRFAPGSIIAGRYEIESRIGFGGVGVVHRARHVELDLRVALKVVRPELARDPAVVARLLEEARAMGSIRCDHIVRVYDVDRLDDGTPYLVLELVDGPDLEQVLVRHGVLSSADVIGFGLDVCRGLSVAHARGIVHRDIKPEHLLLETLPSGEHRVKLSAFGIAERTEAHRTRALTTPSATVESPYYMAPEQLRNGSDVDGRVDVWSLGVVLYELITGRLPFAGATPAEVCARVLSSAPVAPRALRDSIPARLEHVILRCLERDASHRYPDVLELARDLARITVPAGLEARRLSEGPLARASAGLMLPSATGAPASDAHRAAPGELEARPWERPAPPRDTAPVRPQAAVGAPLSAWLSARAEDPPLAVAGFPRVRARGRRMFPSFLVALAVAGTVFVERRGIPPLGPTNGVESSRPSSAPRRGARATTPRSARGPASAARETVRAPASAASGGGGVGAGAGVGAVPAAAAFAAELPGRVAGLVRASASSLRPGRSARDSTGSRASSSASARAGSRRGPNGIPRAARESVPQPPASLEAIETESVPQALDLVVTPTTQLDSRPVDTGRIAVETAPPIASDSSAASDTPTKPPAESPASASAPDDRDHEGSNSSPP